MAAPNSQSGGDRSLGRANSLGLNDKVLNDVLDHLDRTQSAEAAKRRTFSRIPYRRTSVVLAVRTPAGVDTLTKVACRNLSSGGISLLHSAFLHPGSICVVVLEHPLHGNMPVKGKVARCQHRGGLMHEIGIRFDEQINPRDFIDTDVPVLTLESVHPDKLTGTIVHFSPDTEHRQFVRHVLRDLPINLKSVSSMDDLLQQVQRGVDAIFFQPGNLSHIDTQIRELQSRTTNAICILVPVEQLPLQLGTADFRVMTLGWPVDQLKLQSTLAEMLLVLAPGVTRDAVNPNNETMSRITTLAKTLTPLADDSSAGPLAKALSEISRLATLIGRHDLVDLAARARSKLLELVKPEAHRLRQIIKPVNDAILPPPAAEAPSGAAAA
jgi:hypothetical protein